MQMGGGSPTWMVLSFLDLADALMWILHSMRVVSALHYLDDFLLLGPTICEELGLPVAPEKTESPCTALTFLGIEIDTVDCQLRLPQEKLWDLQVPQMDAIWGKTGARSLRQRARFTITAWPLQPRCHSGAAWLRHPACPHRCLCNNSTPGPLGPP